MCQVLSSTICVILLCDSETKDGVYPEPPPARLSGSKSTCLTTRLIALRSLISGVLARAWTMGRRPQLKSTSFSDYICEHWKSIRPL